MVSIAGCGVVDDTDGLVATETSSVAAASTFPIGGYTFAAASCTPVEPAKLYKFNSSDAITDILPAVLKESPGAQALAFKPGDYLNKGQKLNLYVHTSPWRTVSVENGSKGYAVTDLGAGPSAKPVDVAPPAGTPCPKLDATADPYGAASPNFCTLTVIAAKEIRVRLGIYATPGLMLIADKITFDPPTSYQSNHFSLNPKSTPAAPKNPPKPTTIEPGLLYVVAKQIVGTSGPLPATNSAPAPGTINFELPAQYGPSVIASPTVKNPVRLHVALLSENSPKAKLTWLDVISASETCDAWGCQTLKMLNPWPNGLTSLYGSDYENSHADGHVQFSRRSIKPDVFGRLLRHYAPDYLPRAYHEAEASFRKRPTRLPKPLFDQIVTNHAPAESVYGEMSAVRSAQIASGLNYLGESDHIVRRENLDDLLALLEARWNDLKLYELKKTIFSLAGLEWSTVAAALAKDSVVIDADIKSADAEVALVNGRIEAAKAHVNAGQAVISNLSQLMNIWKSRADDIKEVLDVVEDAKKHKGPCQKPWSFWDELMKIFGPFIKIGQLFASVFSFDVSGAFSALGDLMEQSTWTNIKKVVEFGKEAYKTYKEAKPLADAAIDGVKALAEKATPPKINLDDAKLFSEVYKDIDFDGTLVAWRKNGCSTECCWPKQALPPPTDFEKLVVEVMNAREALMAVKQDLEAVQKEMDVAILKKAALTLDKKLTDELKAKVDGFATSGGGTIDIEPGVQSVKEQLCRVGLRKIDSLTRLAYRAAQGLAYLSLNFKNKNLAAALDSPAFATFVSTALFHPATFKFDYDMATDASLDALSAVIIGSTDGKPGLVSAYSQAKAMLAPVQSYAVPIGAGAAVPFGVIASSLDHFKKTGKLLVRVNANALPPKAHRIADVQVVAKGKNAISLIARRMGGNDYRLSDVSEVAIPMANIVTPTCEPLLDPWCANGNASSSAANDANKNQEKKLLSVLSEDLLVKPSSKATDAVQSEIYGFSLAGDWMVELDPSAAENKGTAPDVLLANVTNFEIVFYIFARK
ncbi:MAG: hypothetical protein HYY84_17385 [Deltaproteobacteria bacterium]|nr:hypothetical protein [Deltaproteobacteria bacterium]